MAVRGFEILRDKSRYKSIAFTRRDRLRLGLQGLLPYCVSSQAQLVQRVISILRRVSETRRGTGLRRLVPERHRDICRIFYNLFDPAESVP